ncbi:MAG TPA: hypothetical protein VHG08_15275 [Longimicrobium sp.]|nr:hypothetical protein [Longimicrobium sp.]
MEKLTLNTEDLQVASFPTSRVSAEAGTVHGNAHTHGITCAKPCTPTLNILPTSPCVCID